VLGAVAAPTARRFSTTGPIERAGSEVVLMSAMKNYINFLLVTRCGYPP
jgi:hypothetical protein